MMADMSYGNKINQKKQLAEFFHKNIQEPAWFLDILFAGYGPGLTARDLVLFLQLRLTVLVLGRSIQFSERNGKASFGKGNGPPLFCIRKPPFQIP
ncbi:hypothetical protein EQM14_10085 [Caproiciproducens sp. NJN-50]|uniref:hypothetical protein n=1 Tax=Acutalibacteraceae TaxID=3082771 RepID=UPI000FFE2849|nr:MULTISPECIES: hypothetical protein [Acutalibacteraceae]QAT50095.1 hypothetical protein EQM14_10085 [Caproiciproducens sp. NJN-50]